MLDVRGRHETAGAPRWIAAVTLALSVLTGAGCVGTPRVDSAKPIEYQVRVEADQLWQPSGALVREGQVVQCEARGRWRDADGAYGPEGNPKTYKNHLGVNAPANGLLLKIDGQTNTTTTNIFFVGRETNFIAGCSGPILFRNNVSLAAGMQGALWVRLIVAPDADRDGLSDYDERTLWHTDPLDPDTDGDGFNDGLEMMDRKAQMRRRGLLSEPPLDETEAEEDDHAR